MVKLLASTRRRRSGLGAAARRGLASLLLAAMTLPCAVAQTRTPDPRPAPAGRRGLTLGQPAQAEGPAAARRGQQESKPELIVQTGHADLSGAMSLAFSPDGRLLAASGGDDGVIKLWEVGTGRELRSLESPAPGAQPPALAFSGDSRLFAAGAEGGPIRVWDVLTGTELKTLAPAGGLAAPAQAPTFIAFSADGRSLYSAGDAARTWDLATGAESASAPLPPAGADSPGLFAMREGGGQLAQLASDGRGKVKARVIDLGTGWATREERLEGLKQSPGPARFVMKFTPDGRLLVAALDAGHLKVWDVLAGAKPRALAAAPADSALLNFSPDGSLLAAARGPTLRVLETATGREVTILSGPPGSPSAAGDLGLAAVFSRDGKMLATGGGGSPLTLWETGTGQRLRPLAGNSNAAYAVAFSPDGTQLVSGSRTRWDVFTGAGARMHSRGAAPHAAASADGRLVATVVAGGGAVEIFDAATGARIRTLTPPAGESLAGHLAFSPDARHLATTSRPGGGQARQPPAGDRVTLWDLSTGRAVSTAAPGARVVGAVFSQDGRMLATVSPGGVTVWDAATGARLQTFAARTTAPDGASAQVRGAAVAFSPDGRSLAQGGYLVRAVHDPTLAKSAPPSLKKGPAPQPTRVEVSGLITLWDVSTGKISGTLGAHGRRVVAVAFSGDGRALATAAADNTVRVWDVERRQGGPLLSGHVAAVNSLAFSPDSRLLASAGDDGGTLLWDTKTGERLATLVSLYGGGEWLVITPDGLFDGTPASWNQILWRYDHDTFNVAPVEWFFNEYYHPGLLADIFAGRRPRPADDLARKDRRQPQVKLSLAGGPQPPGGFTSRSVRVRLEVAEEPAGAGGGAGCGARDLRLFRNGALVKVWRGDLLGGRPNVSFEVDVPLVAGENRLVAYAFNRDNVKSKDAALAVTGGEALRRPGKAYVVAVGVDRYANPQFNLRFAAADARTFSEEFARRQEALGQYREAEVVQLLDRDATKARIMRALTELAARAQPEDGVFVFFAGHGLAHENRFYLIPHDLGFEGGRAGMGPAGLRSVLAHSISDRELELAFEKIDAGRLLLVIDACNSGQALESEERRRGPMNSRGLAQLAYEKGMYVLTAAQSYQAALEASQLGHGLLTFALVEEGLKTAAADAAPGDGLLAVREWFDFAAARVPQLQEEKVKAAEGAGRALSFIEDKPPAPAVSPGPPAAVASRAAVQQPRAFYRRELEASPFIVSRVK